MGRASKWFRSLINSRKSLPEPSPAAAAAAAQQLKEKNKGNWVLPKFADNRFRNEDPLASPYIEGIDSNKHAIAVAAATAAVAEAALAAAHASAEVVRLTSGVGGRGSGSGRNVAAYSSSERRRVSAAIKIQSAFRAYLARRALRALKGLVKLQALVRGRIVRKQSADMLRRMQAMARIQARASAQRSQYPNLNFSTSGHPGVANPRKYDPRMSNPKYKIHQSSNPRSSNLNSNRFDNWMEQSDWNTYHEGCRVDDDRSDKILEIDTWKPRQHTGRKDKTLKLPRVSPGQDYSKTSSLLSLSAKTHKPNPSISSEEVSASIISPNFPLEGDQAAAWTADSSSRVHSAADSSSRVHSASSSRQTSCWRGPLTPARSECSRSVFADYLSHPNYMANTESSRAKVRSHSAPKQRLQFDTFGRGPWENDCSSEKGFAVTTNYDNPYFNSACLKRQGRPGHGAANGLGSMYGFRT